jgi:hypothetical protein
MQYDNGDSLFEFGRRGSSFPTPFLDQATQAMPTDLRSALSWSEYIWMSNPTYRMSQERIAAYFLTDLEVSSADDDTAVGDDEKDKWLDFCNNTLAVPAVIQALDLDKACYGNGFASLAVPFKRMLVSELSRSQMAFAEMVGHPRFKLAYDAGANKFTANDPLANDQRCTWTIEDLPDNLEQKLKVKLWSPHEIEIIHDPWTGDCDYVWKIPAHYKQEIRRGNMHLLERAPKQVLAAIAANKWFMFERDALFHMKEPTLSGILSRGWGLSRVMANFRDVWYVQVLRRYNEAIAMDYVIPFRVITPEVRSGSGQSGLTTDPLLSSNMGGFGAAVRSMLRRRRRNPTEWHMLPFPVQYQALGGDAKQLAPAELLDQAYDILLNAGGAPAQLYRGTLELQTAPVSLRLFEATHHALVHGNNQFLRWLVKQTSQLLSFKQIELRMQRVTMADDFQKTMTAMQLYMGQQLSGGSAFRMLGLDWAAEQRRIAEEAGYAGRLQAEVQEEQSQAAFGEQIAKGQAGPGGAPPGGAAPPAGGAAPAGGGDPAAQGGAPSPVQSLMSTNQNVAITPLELEQQADGLATELLGLPETQRLSELRMLKQQSEVLHALVSAKLDQRRSSARSAGQAMLLGQQGAAPAA